MNSHERPMSEPEWTAAACRGLPPAWWFPDKDEPDNHGALAKSMCVMCPRIDDCALGSVERNEAFGIWGGFGEKDRRYLRRAWLADGRRAGPEYESAIVTLRSSVAVDSNGPRAKHGVTATYNRGCRCDPCHQAASMAGVEYRQKARRRTSGQQVAA